MNMTLVHSSLCTKSKYVADLCSLQYSNPLGPDPSQMSEIFGYVFCENLTVRKGSGDIETVSWLYRCVTLPQCYAIDQMPIAHCYTMGCKVVVLHSDWLPLNQDS